MKIKCIQIRPNHYDHIYGTGNWKLNETKEVPDEVARRMLNHPDVYVKSDAKKAEPVEIENRYKPEDSKVQKAYDLIDSMGKDALKTFIKQQFNLDVDLRNFPELYKLRQYATQQLDLVGMLPDSYGLIK